MALANSRGTGFTAAGVQYIRSVQQLLRVVPANLKLQNAAFATAKSDGTIGAFHSSSVTRPFFLLCCADIMLVVDHVSTQYEESFTAYAEVWGTAKDGTLVPVSWIGGYLTALYSSSLRLRR